MSAALASALMLCGTANANPMLELISGSFSTVVTGSSATGVVTYDGPAGQWTINVTTGENVLGGPGLPNIDTDSIDSAPKGSFTSPLASLTIWYTSGGNFAGGTVLGSVGGTTTTSMTDYQYLGSSPFSTSVLLTTLGTFASRSGSTMAFSGSSIGNTGAVTGPYWLSEEIVIGGTHSSAGQSTSFDANSQVVPDGAPTMVLLGSMFACFGLVRSKFDVKRG